MSAIKSLWCLFEEFGIGSTKTPLIDIFLYFHHFSAWYRVDIVKRHYVLMTNESYKVKGFTWGTCTTELARISLASGYLTVIFSITKFLRRKKKTLTLPVHYFYYCYYFTSYCYYLHYYYGHYSYWYYCHHWYLFTWI